MIFYWLTHIVNGLSFGMLLFILAAGLSLIFGLCRIVNLSHGSFYLLGGYIGPQIAKRVNPIIVKRVACVGLLLLSLNLLGLY